jgi:hypothetical protein
MAEEGGNDQRQHRPLSLRFSTQPVFFIPCLCYDSFFSQLIFVDID